MAQEKCLVHQAKSSVLILVGWGIPRKIFSSNLYQFISVVLMGDWEMGSQEKIFGLASSQVWWYLILAWWVGLLKKNFSRNLYQAKSHFWFGGALKIFQSKFVSSQTCCDLMT